MTPTHLQKSAGPGLAPIDWAGVPRVDLLPTEIHLARRLRQVRRRLILLLGGALVLVVGIWSVGEQRVLQAQADLAQVQDRGTQLRNDQAKFQRVPLIEGYLTQVRSNRAAVLANDVQWYQLLDAISAATGDAVTLRSLALNLTASSSRSSSNPLLVSGIGAVNISGEADNYPAVAAWLTAIGSVPGLTAPTLQSISSSTSTAGRVKVSFSVRVTLTAAALSHRFDEKAN